MSIEPNSNWQAGDLAICLTHPDGIWHNCLTGHPTQGPMQDQVLRVTAVEAPFAYDPFASAWLEFDEFPEQLFPGIQFRKIIPDAESATDQHIIALIKGRGLKVAA